ncbi:MAG: glucose-1-phosphate adenylyltransferase [Nitrospira sp.]|nr:glucose-1-phosphate adenylyltransferase [Nitrospira sp.]
MRNVLALILAGGKGSRLLPLTLHRAKPAVPFGGHYRIIDFTLSNTLNSNIRKVAVLTQYKSYSLDRHLRLAWNVVDPEVGEFIISVPPQQRVGQDWYRGTADAVYQNLYLIQQENPNHLFVLSGDHIYKMDYSEMLACHLDAKADATIGVIEVTSSAVSRFGVLEVDARQRVVSFVEKPQVTDAYLSNAMVCYANMGVYLFNVDVLTPYLVQDANHPTHHDFGRDILPKMVKEAQVMAYEFRDENRKQVRYWRDIGTLEAYWEANMDLVAVDPHFNLYDKQWPVRTYHGQHPPAKFVFAEEFKGGRLGIALDSIVCNGCIISGSRVERSVVSPNVRINEDTEVFDSAIMENVVIGQHCKIRKTIIDRDTVVPPKTEIGYDLETDRNRFMVTDSGIVVINQEMISR